MSMPEIDRKDSCELDLRMGRGIPTSSYLCLVGDRYGCAL